MGACLPALAALCDHTTQVREVYRIKGWAFTDPEGIEQCKREGFVQELKEMGEGGCRMFGYIEVQFDGHLMPIYRPCDVYDLSLIHI